MADLRRSVETTECRPRSLGVAGGAELDVRFGRARVAVPFAIGGGLAADSGGSASGGGRTAVLALTPARGREPAPTPIET